MFIEAHNVYVNNATHSFARFVAVSAANFARDWYSQEMLSIIGVT